MFLIEEVQLQLALKESAEYAENAGIATVEESVLSGVIEASLESSRQEPQESEQDDDDIRLDTINEDDQNGAGVEKCDHVKNSVKAATFRRSIGQLKDWDHCQTCRDQLAAIKAIEKKLRGSSVLRPEFANGDSVEALPADALWMCLTCSSINCSLPSQEHARAHRQTNHDHPVSINLSSLDCW